MIFEELKFSAFPRLRQMVQGMFHIQFNSCLLFLSLMGKISAVANESVEILHIVLNYGFQMII